MDKTEAALNQQYGHAGRTFTSEHEARAYASRCKRAWVCEVKDYQLHHLETEKIHTTAGKALYRVKLTPKAKKLTKYWLVSTDAPDQRQIKYLGY